MPEALLRIRKWLLLDRTATAPLLIGILLRASFAFAAYMRTGTRVITQGDTQSYLEPARSLFLTGSYTSGGLPELDRTPGYPLFTASTGAAFGHPLLTVAAQIFVASITLLVLRKIAIAICPFPSAGNFAAWCYACEPLSVTATARVMPETLFVLLIALVIERLLHAQFAKSSQACCSAGLLLAAATFVRPVSYYLLLPLTVALYVALREDNRIRWKAPILFLTATLLCLAPWQLRNYVTSNYTGFSSIVEKNLYFFQSAEISAELSGISLSLQQSRLGYNSDADYLAKQPEQRTWTRAQRLRFMRASASAILKDNPARYLRGHFTGVALVAFTPAATECLQLLRLDPPLESLPRHVVNEGILPSARKLLDAPSSLILVMAIFEAGTLALYVLALWGCGSVRCSSFALTILLGTALYFLLISGGAQAVGRYRLPVIPELCICAGIGLASALQKQRAKPVGPRSLSHTG